MQTRQRVAAGHVVSVFLLTLTAACGPPPLDPAAVRSSAQAACAQAAETTEQLPPVTDEASLDASFIEFSDVDRDPWQMLLDIEPAEEVREDFENLVEGVRLVRVGASSTLTAWRALDEERIAEIRADVESGVDLMDDAADELDAPACTAEAWDVAFVLEALEAAETSVAAAAPTGVYRDDVNAACVRFNERIVREYPATAETTDLYLFVSHLESEAQNLGGFLERLDPHPELANAHRRLVDGAEQLRRSSGDLAQALVSDDPDALGPALTDVQSDISEVEAGFDALGIPCKT